jgi:hypothetical protein
MERQVKMQEASFIWLSGAFFNNQHGRAKDKILFIQYSGHDFFKKQLQKIYKF